MLCMKCLVLKYCCLCCVALYCNAESVARLLLHLCRIYLLQSLRCSSNRAKDYFVALTLQILIGVNRTFNVGRRRSYFNNLKSAPLLCSELVKICAKIIKSKTSHRHCCDFDKLKYRIQHSECKPNALIEKESLSGREFHIFQSSQTILEERSLVCLKFRATLSLSNLEIHETIAEPVRGSKVHLRG